MAVVTLRPFGLFAGETVGTVELVALLVCLIPTTIGGLLSAIGIAGMDRVARFNVLAMSGRAVEASGDVDVILLDKTGTITYGNRLAASITPVSGVSDAGRPDRCARVIDPRRDARGPFHRGAGPPAARGARGPGGRRRRGWLRPPGRHDRRGDPLHGPDPHEWCAHEGRDDGPQGGRRRHRSRARPHARGGRGPGRRHLRPGGHAPGHPARTTRSSASSSSRTPSRRDSSSASRSSAAWASARS